MSKRLGSCLEGVRVLELGSAIAGPSAARHLADMGAHVVKIEPPAGDQLRTWGVMAPDGSSWWFKSHNRNKDLVMFDLRRESDVEAVRKLALECDVIIENFRPGLLKKYGLDAATLREAKPALIYASISGYGQDGPMAARPGYGAIAEALAGFRHITGDPDGPPMRMGLSIADELAGLQTAFAIVAALRAREIDGGGETIDVSLIESTFSLLEGVLPDFVHGNHVAARTGNRLATTAPSNVYPTLDKRWIAISGNGESIFRRLAAAMGSPELADDPRFASSQARLKYVEDLDATIAAWTAAHPFSELNERLAEAGVPAGPILSIADIVAHPQFQARGAIQTILDDDGSEVATYGPAAHLKDRPVKLGRAAGRVGRDQPPRRQEV